MGEKGAKRKTFMYLEILMCLVVMGLMFTVDIFASDQIYDQYFTGTGEITPFGDIFYNVLRGIYDYLREFLVLVIVVSEIIGIFILRALSKRNKALKQKAIFGWIIGIPMGVIMIFFGMAFYLNQYF